MGVSFFRVCPTAVSEAAQRRLGGGGRLLERLASRRGTFLAKKLRRLLKGTFFVSPAQPVALERAIRKKTQPASWWRGQGWRKGEGALALGLGNRFLWDSSDLRCGFEKGREMLAEPIRHPVGLPQMASD